MQATLFAFFEIVVRSSFDSRFDAMYLVIDRVVFIEQPGEMVIGHFQLMDGVAVLG
jgi:hypothetical protein